MHRLVTTVLVAVATLIVAVSPALACGGYGDPLEMAEMDVAWTSEWVDTSRDAVKEALATGDADAIDEALSTFESAVEALTQAEARLAELEQSERDEVSLASSAAP